MPASVIAFEPMPSLADALRAKFRQGVEIRSIALSDRAGTVELHMPVVDGVTVTGCSTVSPTRLRHLSRPPRHRGADGDARQRL